MMLSTLTTIPLVFPPLFSKPPLVPLVPSRIATTDSLLTSTVLPSYPNSGIVATSNDLAGPSILSQYVDLAVSWSPTATRTVNFDFGVPYSADVVQGQIYAGVGKSCPAENIIVGLVGTFALSREDLTNFAPAPYNTPDSVVSFDSADGDAIQAAFDADEINAFLYFPNDNITTDNDVPVLGDTCTNPFDTENFTFGPLISKKGACNEYLLTAWYEGLRRIVNNGTYAIIIQELGGGEITRPWTPDNFPDLVHPNQNSIFEMALVSRLGNRSLYTNSCDRLREKALRDACRDKAKKPRCPCNKCPPKGKDCRDRKDKKDCGCGH